MFVSVPARVPLCVPLCVPVCVCVCVCVSLLPVPVRGVACAVSGPGVRI